MSQSPQETTTNPPYQQNNPDIPLLQQPGLIPPTPQQPPPPFNIGQLLDTDTRTPGTSQKPFSSTILALNYVTISQS